jgi:hypothetical protein
MWQLQWVLSLIPESVLLWIYYLILSGGIILLLAGWIVKWLPGISPYKTPLQILGVLLTAGSLYLLGGYGVEMAWRDKVKQLEEKVQIAEEMAKNKNVEVQTKIVEKTKVIKEKAKTQIEYVDRVITQDKEVVKYIEQCPVPKIIVDEHNKAATPPDVIKELNKAAEGKK